MTGKQVARALTIPEAVIDGITPASGLLVIVDGEGVSRLEFNVRARAVASGLVASGVGVGERVAVLMPNSVEMLATIIGAMLAGALPVPLNIRYGQRELEHVIRDCGPAALFVTEAASRPRGLLERVGVCLNGAVGQRCTGSNHDGVILTKTGEVLTSEAFGQRSRGRVWQSGALLGGNPAADAVLLYTSGTTAAPRGCVLSHRAVLGNARALADEVFRLNDEDRLWNPLPFCHIGSLMPFVACSLSGATFYSTGHFEPSRAVEQLSDGCTVAHPSFETIWTPVLAEAARRNKSLDHLRLVHLVGTPSRMAAAQAALPGAELVAGYGATEVAGVVCMHRPSDGPESRLTTCGAPLPGVEVAIFDLETGRLLPAGASGEIRVRGYPLLTRYLDMAGASGTLEPGEWFRTGDRGQLDERGHLVFQGRTKDALKVGGENVSALEVESCLVEHPGVLLAQVVGVPDERLGEVPVAFVQVASDVHVTTDDLIAFCRRRLASFKVPRQVQLVTEWPMSATKIQKGTLREWARESVTRAGGL